MKSIYLNKNGDFELNSLNSFKMINSIDEIKQRLKISLITEAKEWFLDLDFGVPWFIMLENSDPPENFRKEILKVLLSDPAVEKVYKINTEFDKFNRKLNIDFSIKVGEEAIAESVVIE